MPGERKKKIFGEFDKVCRIEKKVEIVKGTDREINEGHFEFRIGKI